MVFYFKETKLAFLAPHDVFLAGSMVHHFNILHSALGIRHLGSSKYQACTKYKVLCTKTLIEQNSSQKTNPYLVLGTWYLVLGTWYIVQYFTRWLHSHQTACSSP